MQMDYVYFFEAKGAKSVQNTLISFGMLFWVFQGKEVAEMFNTWAIFRHDKPSLINIITLFNL